MKPEDPPTEIDDPRTWSLPLAQVDASLFRNLLSLIEDQSELADYFSSEEPLGKVRDRLAELQDFPLLRFGEEDGPCYETLGIVWDNARNEGVLYRGFSCDDVSPVVPVAKLSPETVFPLVRGQLLGVTGLMGVMDSTIEFNSDKIAVKSVESTLDSLTWVPEGFDVYDSDLVPRNMMQDLITEVYEKSKPEAGEWVREQCPTPGDWLNTVYGGAR